MASKSSEKVRERAYHLWQESGGEHGRDMEHWLRAERESGSASAGGEAPETSSKTAAAKKAAAKPVAEKSPARKAAAPKAPAPKAPAPKAAPGKAGTAKSPKSPK